MKALLIELSGEGADEHTAALIMAAVATQLAQVGADVRLAAQGEEVEEVLPWALAKGAAHALIGPDAQSIAISGAALQFAGLTAERGGYPLAVKLPGKPHATVMVSHWSAPDGRRSRPEAPKRPDDADAKKHLEMATRRPRHKPAD